MLFGLFGLGEILDSEMGSYLVMVFYYDSSLFSLPFNHVLKNASLFSFEIYPPSSNSLVKSPKFYKKTTNYSGSGPGALSPCKCSVKEN